MMANHRLAPKRRTDNALKTMGAATSPRAAATSARLWNLDGSGAIGVAAAPDRPSPRAAEHWSRLGPVPYQRPAGRSRESGVLRDPATRATGTGGHGRAAGAVPSPRALTPGRGAVSR
ncbi:hypothetical protein SEVIR_5G375250v4 [Setaria viridis]